jgi:hypothetical protein
MLNKDQEASILKSKEADFLIGLFLIDFPLMQGTM